MQPGFIAFTIFFASFLILAAVTLRRHLREARLRRYVFPSGLQRKLQQRFPQYNAEQWQEVLEGLRDWFAVARRAGRRPISMPSQAVDEAWHEFILFTRSYQEFCTKALGRYLHHVPAEAMESPTQAQQGLRRAWRISCLRERINPRRPHRLPRMFAIDAALAFPGGFIYALDCMHGRQQHADSHCASHIGCSSCGSGCGTSGCGSSSSSSSDGGSGCGGGCGGD